MTIGGLEIDPATGQLKITYGSRVAATTEGTLVCLTPTVHNFSGLTLTFPDPPKDWIYAWRGKQNWVSVVGGNNYAQSETAQVFFTRTPQEYESGVNLVAAPAGADFFVGHVRLSRTVAPTHQWAVRDLNPAQKMGEWIPWLGSGLLEVGLGLARAMHLVIEGGFLKLIAEQTVGPAVGGAVHNWGDVTPANIYDRRRDGEGGTFRVNATPGLVVWTSNDLPYRRTLAQTQNGLSDITNPSDMGFLQYGSASALPTTDPTNYRSVYSVDIKGQFGRRS